MCIRDSRSAEPGTTVELRMPGGMDGAADHGQPAGPRLSQPRNQRSGLAGGVRRWPFHVVQGLHLQADRGHRALAGEVVEDLALARAIKAGGHRLRYLLGLDAVDLRMYSNLAALWEGWTKNWFLGLDRDPFKALGAALVVVLMFSVPWLLLPASLLLLWLQPLLASAWWWLMALASLAILQQLLLRLWTRSSSC